MHNRCIADCRIINFRRRLGSGFAAIDLHKPGRFRQLEWPGIFVASIWNCSKLLASTTGKGLFFQ
jgi:hypothetical protein